MSVTQLYQSFLQSPTAPQWEKIGIVRRAGVVAPLFSVYSRRSAGVGEIPDLELLGEWCRACGMSVIQLLPLNDVGFNFRPYDASSTFALEPMHLSFEKLQGCPVKLFQEKIDLLRKQFPAGRARVDYGIKKAKLELFREIFEKTRFWPEGFQQFVKQNSFWLEDYALFNVLKQICRDVTWEDWPEPFKNRDAAALEEIRGQYPRQIEFQKWLQWQLFEQCRRTREKLNESGILLMGDLPFLVSRDSADVWAHQDYFKLNLSSGAPPDAYFAAGQRWGMPPYDWDRIASQRYDYLVEKIRYAANFYDLFRIDHVVGIFRLWTIPLSEPLENAGLNGTFDPQDESKWEEHGRGLLAKMTESSMMLPTAEDLGVVPDCSYRTLEAFAVPGLDVQRWTKYWNGNYEFKRPEDFRKNSTAVISTHDMSSFLGWWAFEAGTVDGALFKRLSQEKGIAFDALKDALFDAARSRYGRLRWKESVQTLDAFLQIMGKRREEIPDLADFYLGSFDEKRKFWNYLGLDAAGYHENAPAPAEAALRKVSETASIFSIQMLQDWLSLGDVLKAYDVWDYRINFPGTISEKNWSWTVPVSLEAMKTLPINEKILKMNRETERV